MVTRPASRYAVMSNNRRRASRRFRECSGESDGEERAAAGFGSRQFNGTSGQEFARAQGAAKTQPPAAGRQATEGGWRTRAYERTARDRRVAGTATPALSGATTPTELPRHSQLHCNPWRRAACDPGSGRHRHLQSDPGAGFRQHRPRLHGAGRECPRSDHRHGTGRHAHSQPQLQHKQYFHAVRHRGRCQRRHRDCRGARPAHHRAERDERLHAGRVVHHQHRPGECPGCVERCR